MAEWCFTTEGKDEAVNGNWSAYRIPEDCVGGGKWVLYHKDFPLAGRTEGIPLTIGNAWTRVVEEQWEVFAEWLASQVRVPALDRLESYVNHPGNWSAFDGRRRHLSELIEQVREERECTS